VMSRSMNFTNGIILSPSICLCSQERVATNDCPEKRGTFQRRAQETVPGEELVLIAEAVIDPNIEVIYVVSDGVAAIKISLSNRYVQVGGWQQGHNLCRSRVYQVGRNPVARKRPGMAGRGVDVKGIIDHRTARL